MNRDFYKPVIGLLWLALPIAALKYWLAWDRLPMRMAVHFSANSQPNGWTTRLGAVQSGIGIMVFLLVAFTVVGLVMHSLKPRAVWLMLVVFYVVIGFAWYGNSSIVDWNLRNNPARHAALLPTK
jgi:uncharacterized membrane protein